jgi:outer membrane protein assembly factor BamB
LYTDSVLAIDPDTGDLKWHFQFTPHDVWDYDANTDLFLVDVQRGGQTVKALAQPNRNGFLYVPVIESCMRMKKAAAMFIQGIPYWDGGWDKTQGDDRSSYGYLSAIDPTTGAVKSNGNIKRSIHSSVGRWRRPGAGVHRQSRRARDGVR